MSKRYPSERPEETGADNDNMSQTSEAGDEAGDGVARVDGHGGESEGGGGEGGGGEGVAYDLNEQIRELTANYLNRLFHLKVYQLCKKEDLSGHIQEFRERTLDELIQYGLEESKLNEANQALLRVEKDVVDQQLESFKGLFDYYRLSYLHYLLTNNQEDLKKSWELLENFYGSLGSAYPDTVKLLSDYIKDETQRLVDQHKENPGQTKEWLAEIQGYYAESDASLFGFAGSLITHIQKHSARSPDDHAGRDGLDPTRPPAPPPPPAPAPASAPAPVRASASAPALPNPRAEAGYRGETDPADHAELENSGGVGGQHYQVKNPKIVPSGDNKNLDNAILEALKKLKDEQYEDSSVMFYLDHIRLKLFKASDQRFYIEATEPLIKTKVHKLEQNQIRIDVTDLPAGNVVNRLNEIYMSLKLPASQKVLKDFFENNKLVCTSSEGPNAPVCYVENPNPLERHFEKIINIAFEIESYHTPEFKQFIDRLLQANDDTSVQLPLLAQLFIIDQNNISEDFCQFRASLKKYLDQNNLSHILDNLLHIADSSLTEEAHNAKFEFENFNQEEKRSTHNILCKYQEVPQITADNHVSALSQFKTDVKSLNIDNISGYSIFKDGEGKYEVSLLHKRTYYTRANKTETHKQEILTGEQANNFVRLVRLSSSKSYMKDCKMQSYHSSLFETTNANFTGLPNKDINLNIDSIDQLDSRLALIDVLTQQNANRSRSAQYSESGKTAPSSIEKNKTSHKFSNPNLYDRSVQVGISCERITENQVYIRRVYDENNETPNIQWVVLKDTSGKIILDESNKAGFVKVKFEDDGNISIDFRNIYLASDNTSPKKQLALDSNKDFEKAFRQLEITAESCSVTNPKPKTIFKKTGDTSLTKPAESDIIYLKDSKKSKHSSDIDASGISLPPPPPARTAGPRIAPGAGAPEAPEAPEAPGAPGAGARVVTMEGGGAPEAPARAGAGGGGVFSFGAGAGGEGEPGAEWLGGPAARGAPGARAGGGGVFSFGAGAGGEGEPRAGASASRAAPADSRGAPRAGASASRAATPWSGRVIGGPAPGAGGRQEHALVKFGHSPATSTELITTRDQLRAGAGGGGAPRPGESLSGPAPRQALGPRGGAAMERTQEIIWASTDRRGATRPREWPPRAGSREGPARLAPGAWLSGAGSRGGPARPAPRPVPEASLSGAGGEGGPARPAPRPGPEASLSGAGSRGGPARPAPRPAPEAPGAGARDGAVTWARGYEPGTAPRTGALSWSADARKMGPSTLARRVEAVTMGPSPHARRGNAPASRG